MDKLAFASPSTKDAAAVLSGLSLVGTTVILTAGADNNVYLSARNLSETLADAEVKSFDSLGKEQASVRLAVRPVSAARGARQNSVCVGRSRWHLRTTKNG